MDSAPGLSRDDDDAASRDAARQALENAGMNAPAKARPGRPPLWLMLVTISIPVALGTIWYYNWYGRNLTCPEILHALRGRDEGRQHQAMYSLGKRLEAFPALGFAAPNVAAVVSQDGDDPTPCLQETLTFAERLPERPQLRAATAQTLGYFFKVPDSAMRARARALLETIHISGERIGRFQAAASLSQFGDRSPEVRATLVQMLNDDDVLVRRNGVMALGRVGDAGSADALKRLAGNDPDPQVRQLADMAWQATAQVAP